MHKGYYAPYKPDEYSEYHQPYFRDSTPKITPLSTEPQLETRKPDESSKAKEIRTINQVKTPPAKEATTYYVTNAGRFLRTMSVDDLFKARKLLTRFEKGNTLSIEQLEFLLKNDLLEEKQW